MTTADKAAATILLTGGAGFIGSHCIVELVKEGFQCIVVDNFSNSYPESLERVEKIVQQNVTSYNIDIRNQDELAKVFTNHKIDAVIHLAGLKSVSESCSIPLDYYNNNVSGSVVLFQVMQQFNVNKLVFSSSATVYGSPQYLPLDEKHPTGGCSNPYGNTKFVIEKILEDTARARKELGVICLRYFNPVGAHESGLIGEDPHGIPNNLMPYITQVAVGRRDVLQVFGNDYETTDGTGVRDYIHVVDLAIGHVAAVRKILSTNFTHFQAYNLGTGNGHSVLEVLSSMEKAAGKAIPNKICPRRAGDLATIYSDVTLVQKHLSWTAKKDLDKMCEDSWRFQQMNPKGYRPNEIAG